MQSLVCTQYHVHRLRRFMVDLVDLAAILSVHPLPTVHYSMQSTSKNTPTRHLISVRREETRRMFKPEYGVPTWCLTPPPSPNPQKHQLVAARSEFRTPIIFIIIITTSIVIISRMTICPQHDHPPIPSTASPE